MPMLQKIVNNCGQWFIKYIYFAYAINFLLTYAVHKKAHNNYDYLDNSL